MKQNLGVVRHGEARYETLHLPEKGVFNVTNFLESFALVKDLKENSLESLKQYLDSFVKSNLESLKSKSRIDLWVSPFGRTIETAHILLNILIDNGISVKKICIFNKLGEVKNFYWPTFNAMVTGSKVIIDGKEYNFDKTKTNPNNLSHSEYFFQSYWMNVDKNYLSGLGVLELVTSIETYDSITNRSKQSLSKLLNFVGDDKMTLIVSHQAFTDWILKGGEGYKNGGQIPGEVLLLNADLINNPNGYERINKTT